MTRRITEQGGLFYPEKKHFGFWGRFYDEPYMDMDGLLNIPKAKSFASLEEAKAFLERSKKPQVVVYAENKNKE